jgi:perosamine synthetase
MDAILDIARNHNLIVIEDAAEAAGARYKGKPAGSFGDVSTFSFHGSKTLTTGEGGLLLCDDPEIYRKCMFYRDHGREPGDKMFFNREVAYKYKMSSMQAAMGLAQLERIEELVKQKREFFHRYQERLSGVEGIRLNETRDNVYNTYWMNSIVLDKRYPITIEGLIGEFGKRNIDTRSFFHPLSSLPAYGFLKAGNYAKNSRK